MSQKRSKRMKIKVCRNEGYEEEKKEETVIRGDGLAVFTDYTKIACFAIANRLKSFEDSKWYKILSRTTQPAHFVMLLAVSVVGFLMYANPNNNAEKPSQVLSFIYLGSVSAHFGAQLWMIFVSRLALYYCLPPRIFLRVQIVLFPKYIFMNAFLSLVSLVIFINRSNLNLDVPDVSLQIKVLTLRFLTELIVRLYLTPPLLRLTERIIEYEEAAGVGMEIGNHDAGILSTIEDYLAVYKTFSKVHCAIAIGNLITLVCSVIHLNYLAYKLDFAGSN